jgi:hypothetical protein
MAETLQRSLLLAGLPEVDGLEVVTRYLPAVRGTAAGGDWYDLHRLADGTVALNAGRRQLLLLTDGLIERRDQDLDAGLYRLSVATATRCGAPLDALVDGLLADLVDVGGAADDIAVVAVRRVSRG